MRAAQKFILASQVGAFVLLGLSVASLFAVLTYGSVSLLFPWFSFGVFTLEAGVLLDYPAVLMLVMLAIVSGAIQYYAAWYLADDAGLIRFFAVLNLFVLAMVGFVVAPSLVQAFLCWEVMGVCSFLLIGFWYEKKEAIAGARKAFLMTRFGDAGLLLGVGALLAHFGTATFATMEMQAAQEGFLDTLPALGLVLVFFGVIGKSAQLPLHNWLPSAMVGPTPASALIHAATMVASGVFLLIRLVPIVEASTSFSVLQPFGMVLGTLTVVWGALLAVVQVDLKKVLAYSTISQLGYMVTAALAGFASAALFHLLTHAFFKALLFLGAGVLIHHYHTQDMHSMGKGWGKLRVVAVLFLIGSASLIGVVPFAGFWSKDEILVLLWEHGDYVAFWGLLLGVLLTAVYAVGQIFLVFFSTPIHGKQSCNHDHSARFPGRVVVPLGILAGGALITGLLNTPFAPLLSRFLGEEGHHGPLFVSGSIMLASTCCVLAGGVCSWMLLYHLPHWYQAITRLQSVVPHAQESRWHLFFRNFHRTRPFLDTFIARVLAPGLSLTSIQVRVFDESILTRGVLFGGRFLLKMSHVLARLDTILIDGIVQGIASAISGVGTLGQRVQTHHLQGYLLFFLLGCFILGGGVIVFLWFF